MSWVCDTTERIPGSWGCSRHAGFGVLAENIPSGGGSGPSTLFGCVSLPADAGKEICGTVTRWPASPLPLEEDGSLVYTGSPDYFEFRLYVDGVASTTDIGFGPGISRITLAGPGGFTAGLQLDDSTAAGAFASSAPSAFAGAVPLVDAFAAGAFVSGAGAITTHPRRLTVQAASRLLTVPAD